MTRINRAVLERDGVRQAVRDSGHAHLLMSDDAVARSFADVMATHRPGAPIWIFGYGSLIWNPMMEYAAREPAQVHGYHRGFYIWSKINRGTPAVPGLVLALDRGGSCRGIAYRLHPHSAAEDLRLLWRREMVAGTYRAAWVTVNIGNRSLRAIAFVVRRDHPGYTGRLDDRRIVSIARTAVGQYGPCAEYLMNTAAGLEAAGIADARLSRLAKSVAQGLDITPQS